MRIEETKISLEGAIKEHDSMNCFCCYYDNEDKKWKNIKEDVVCLYCKTVNDKHYVGCDRPERWR